MWSDVEVVLDRIEGVLVGIGNLVNWEVGRHVCWSTVARALGDVSEAIDVLVSLGYLARGGGAQGATLALTREGWIVGVGS